LILSSTLELEPLPPGFNFIDFGTIFMSPEINNSAKERMADKKRVKE
jgi:hypothetical protein